MSGTPLKDAGKQKSGKFPNLFSILSYQQVQADLTKQVAERDEYIALLQQILKEHELPIPDRSFEKEVVLKKAPIVPSNIMQQGTVEELESIINRRKALVRSHDFAVEFYDLTMSVEVPVEHRIFSVSTILESIFCFWTTFTQQKKDVHIISNLTGRILPRKMTLLIGPPGSGKSVLLKALAGFLRPLGGAHISGDVYYDGDNIRSNRFLVQKVSSYIEQDDTHSAVLTVEETLKFAWLCATGGHHSYARAKDEASAKKLDDEDDPHFAVVQNVIASLGLKGCKDTLVGNQLIRGVSGGQKRRVTVGEMIVVPRPVKFMDCISNGLDSATTYDIIAATRFMNHTLGLTNLISLLQPSPDVFNLFDELIIMCEGHIIYQASREEVLPYFASLGYHCPRNMDVADFLQELPTSEGRRFVKQRPRLIPHTPIALATAWKSSRLYEQMLAEMKYASGSDAEKLSTNNPKQWYPDQKEKFASKNPWFYLKLNLERQVKILSRDATFLKARIGQVFIVGAIAGSLFSNIETENISTMNGFLFNTLLFNALGSFAILPILYSQKTVFYKMKDALFFPTWTFTLASTLSLIPLQLVEGILYCTIVYWSAGLSDQMNGSRFLTFILISFVYSSVIAQLFRFFSSIIASAGGCLPVAGLDLVIMVLFSGFIQPKSLISNGWIWFYYLNPTAWALKAVTINEFKSSKYDFPTCVNAPSCTVTGRFGDVVLNQYGIETDERYIWYSFAVLIAEFLALFVVSTLALEYIRTEAAPPAPLRSEDKGTAPQAMKLTWEKIENDVKAHKVSEHEEGKKQDDSSTGKLQITVDAEYVSSFADPLSPVPTGNKGGDGAFGGDIEMGTIQSSVKLSERPIEELEFDQVSLAFVDIWYTVTLSNGEDIDLLKGVNGFFEPGTMTALMGSSGAGKTTLLDVLAGRKNTGVVKGEMYLNGLPKIEGYFRKIMGYVEQFDTLPQKSTAREAIEFSAALRLAASITSNQREKWVNSVLHMLDLDPIENDLIGRMDSGGMSFEQRKRVSIGVELAANPSILFLDEPTTGLDSLAAQSLIKNIRKIAASGRSIVCTIHQPSSSIFNAFDSLLLLKRGGQTVFFGNMGEHSQNLVDFFEAAPGVSKMPVNTNPASWMLEMIGAGTAIGGSVTSVDFHAYYKSSALCYANDLHLQALITPNAGSKKLEDHDQDILNSSSSTSYQYNASYFQQFRLLMNRIHLTYWRSPSYSFIRHITNVLIALIFGSAYPQQMYSTYVAAVSRSAVIYITALFCGVLAMILVQPMMSAERPVFYREQQSRMYAVWVYALTLVLIEIPYLLIASLAFVLPFFYIVGYGYLGDSTQKFFWYWLFCFLSQASMLFLGEFLVALTPNEQTSQVLGGLFNTVNGLFCGFLIQEQNFPTFWLFMYWLNPLHYLLEGLIMTQFHADTTPITTLTGQTMTAQDYMDQVQFSTWSYGHVGYDVLALCIFSTIFILGMYLSLAFLRHDKR